jgi:hypothetical protein
VFTVIKIFISIFYLMFCSIVIKKARFPIPDGCSSCQLVKNLPKKQERLENNTSKEEVFSLYRVDEALLWHVLNCGIQHEA